MIAPGWLAGRGVTNREWSAAEAAAKAAAWDAAWETAWYAAWSAAASAARSAAWSAADAQNAELEVLLLAAGESR